MKMRWGMFVYPKEPKYPTTTGNVPLVPLRAIDVLSEINSCIDTSYCHRPVANRSANSVRSTCLAPIAMPVAELSMSELNRRVGVNLLSTAK